METNIKQRCGNRHKERDKSGKKRRSIRRRKKGIGERARCAKAHGTREGTPYSLSPHRTDPRKLSFLGIRLRRVYMNSSGFSVWYTLAMSSLIYGGSLEMLAVQLLLSPFAPLETLLFSLLIQMRHIFYGIAMLDIFPKKGLLQQYLIFGMCDETFAINYSTAVPKGIPKDYFMFWVTLLNHFYWVFGACLGSLIGDALPFPTKGIEFVMTTMFFLIFLEQVLQEKNHIASFVGLFSSFLCLILFHAKRFILPSMLLIFLLLTLLRPLLGKSDEITISKKEEYV